MNNLKTSGKSPSSAFADAFSRLSPSTQKLLSTPAYTSASASTSPRQSGGYTFYPAPLPGREPESMAHDFFGMGRSGYGYKNPSTSAPTTPAAPMTPATPAAPMAQPAPVAPTAPAQPEQSGTQQALTSFGIRQNPGVGSFRPAMNTAPKLLSSGNPLHTAGPRQSIAPAMPIPPYTK